ncbi:MAG: hypothetical protein HS113_01275 [Verrucomicrobiales bacterium]|nr:hypothetical protein [Verrucomicrobiales bacterium]
MLEECLTPQGRRLRWVIRLLRPSFFRPDLDAIQRLGETDSWLAFRAELEGFSQDNQMRGSWVRNVLKVRLSGRLLNELAEYLFAGGGGKRASAGLASWWRRRPRDGSSRRWAAGW